MLVITGHLEGDVVIQRQLAGLEARMSDMTPAWPAVLSVFRGIMRAAFATEGGSTGAPWPQLAERTVKDRERQGFPGRHPILARTHTLARALTTEGGASVVVQMPRYFAVAVDLDYFKFHQSKRPRAKIPRRAPINLTQDDKTALLHPIRLYVTGRMQ
ncbi:MAG: phage virion morphogenesis protein [Gemmatimonadota bacterium]|nr:phage virion morphogenesis protein [Gemmatimonadota bacterium]